MRKLLLFLSLFVCYFVQVDAQHMRDMMVVQMNNGSTYRFAVDSIDYIEFVQEEVPDPRQAIDLGLSVKWAACNIGAETPEAYGDLFSWAETTPKNDYSEENYLYYVNYSYVHIGNNISGTKYDAATAQWGGTWRMPNLYEIQELMSCTWTSETLNGVKGYRVTGKNGNSIFLPAAGYQPANERLSAGEQGYYWSSAINPEMKSSAYNINFRGYDELWSASRAYGFSIRAVKD